MADRKYYVVCDLGCKFESMTKEQILTAIMQAVSEGAIRDIDTGFITTIKTINGLPLRFFCGEQSEYEKLTEEERMNLFALITNDTTKEGILTALEAHATNLEAHSAKIAEHSEKIEENSAKIADFESGAAEVHKATKLSPAISKTISYTSDKQINECDLEAAVYLVIVRLPSSYVAANLILSVGDVKKHFWKSTISASNVDASEWYCRMSATAANVPMLTVYKKNMTTGNFEEYSGGALTVSFVKIADYPDIVGAV